MDGLGRRTASGYAGNWDDGPRNRTEAETHADRRVRPNAPPEEKDIGTAALRLIRDDCQAGSVRVPDCAGRPFMRSSSVVGTFETCREVRRTVAFGGKADVARTTRAFSTVSLSMLFKEIYETAGSDVRAESV